MTSIQITEAYGVVQARRPSPEPTIPGWLVASAMAGHSGWYVSHRANNGLHLMFCRDEAEARRLLELVAGVLA